VCVHTHTHKLRILLSEGKVSQESR